MNLLIETPVGFGIFKVKNRSKLSDEEYVRQCLETEEGVRKLIKLTTFEKFKSVDQALKFEKRLVEGNLSKKLKNVIQNDPKLQQAQLAVCDPKIGQVLKEHFNMDCLISPIIQDLYRGIREHICSLVPDIDENQYRQMSIALAHGYSRYKLKFSPNRVDTMIIQGIKLIDDLDKEINNYLMRCKEWYGLHFPELAKYVPDNITYIKVIQELRFKTNTKSVSLQHLIDDETIKQIQAAAALSVGSEITEDDMDRILRLCSEIIHISDYKGELSNYLINRMRVVAPNLSLLVGEIVGARLIAHTGSLYNLAKSPSSTIQVLGAEKALFSALKARKNTPKYGLIYHSELVASASLPCKGKMSRSLAAKCALAVRCDALSEKKIETDLSIISLNKLNARLKEMEYLNTNKQKLTKHHFQAQQYTAPSLTTSYKAGNDIIIPPIKRKNEDDDISITEVSAISISGESKKLAKRKKEQ